MTPAEINRRMGATMRDLLADLPVPWDAPHSSTREALISRGLAVQAGDTLVITGRGIDVLLEIGRTR